MASLLPGSHVLWLTLSGGFIPAGTGDLSQSGSRLGTTLQLSALAPAVAENMERSKEVLPPTYYFL